MYGLEASLPDAGKMAILDIVTEYMDLLKLIEILPNEERYELAKKRMQRDQLIGNDEVPLPSNYYIRRDY